MGKRERPNIKGINVWWILAFLLVQVLFIVAGLGIIFWTLNKWDAGDGIDALFGAGLGGFAFFFTWNLIRSWARGHMDIWRPDSDNSVKEL